MFPSQSSISYLRSFFLNGLLVSLIFFFLCFLSYPLLINADFLVGWEEAQLVNWVLDMVRGGPIFFYHEGVSYQGILDTLVALPFFYFFGVNTLALKLSSLCLFALYIWSCFFLSYLINQKISWVTLILLLFPPMSILMTTYLYGSYSLICFLGNVILILFCRTQSEDGSSPIVIFFIFFVMGLAIYSFTYAILYIATVFILFVLSQPQWGDIRSNISFKKLNQMVWAEQTTKGKMVFIFDSLILVFIFGVLFSYVFGGFGIDIGGVSIFQINNLHKPVGQLAILIIIRAVVFGKKQGVFIRKAQEIQSSFSKKSKQFLVLGMVGFFIGLSPRLASIASGETRRGGQGFDVDLVPAKVLTHFWEIIAETIPKILGLSQPIGRIFSSKNLIHLGLGFMALTIILPLFVTAIWRFYISQLHTLKRIICLRQLEFVPVMLLLVFPVFVVLANAFTMNGPMLRYLFPLNAVFGIWAAFILYRVKERSIVLFTGILFVWISFYSMNTYQYYSERNFVKGFQPVVQREPILDVIKFVETKNVPVIYSNFYFMQKARFLGQKRLKFRSCFNPYKYRSKCKWQVLSHGSQPVENAEVIKLEHDNFAFVVSTAQADDVTKEFLISNNILFQSEKIENYFIFWGFQGSGDKIDKIPVLEFI